LNKQEIKSYLKNNPEKIKDILEELGCNHIKIVIDKRVQSALPDGNNATSVQVKLNDSLSTIVYTRNQFNKQEYKDLFTLIEFINNCNFNQAMNFVCEVCGISYNGKLDNITPSSVSILDKLVKNKERKEKNKYTEFILDESFTERFVRNACKIFIEDGINEITQNKFGVSYDVLENRVVFPIRNDEGDLLTFKGRTLREDYKIMGIPKYYYYYSYIGERYLFGLYENYFDIISANEIYVGEAEKFVMQLDSMGINNCVSISKKVISPIQLDKLLKLKKDIVLAFDKDVTLEEIFIECRKFKGLCNVYYIYDTLDLLNGKESPSDRDKTTFMRLVNECKFKYEEEL
jgi:DNA primase